MPASAASATPKREHDAVDHVDVDAERPDHAAVVAGTDHAQAGALDQVERDCEHDADAEMASRRDRVAS